MDEDLKFVWNDYYWETEVNLPAFSGFQERKGPYGALSSDSPSTGDVSIAFSAEARDDSPINEEEKKLINWFLDNNSTVISVVKDILFRAYPEIKNGYIEEFGEEVADLFPPVTEVEDIKSVLGIVNIHIHTIAKDNIPVIGLEIGCDWEEEHGIGMLFWKDRILDFGQADTAFVNWIAKKSVENI